jgi:four helix bundle protein
MDFSFEKLTVYQAAVKFCVVATSLENIPHTVADQLSRAALSIPNNIAEGSGRWSKKEKRHFFNIARASVFECVAILQVIRQRKLVPESTYAEAYQTLGAISRMLMGLIRANET